MEVKNVENGWENGLQAEVCGVYTHNNLSNDLWLTEPKDFRKGFTIYSQKNQTFPRDNPIFQKRSKKLVLDKLIMR